MRYLTCDVFTDTPFAGNPLAVVPDAVDVPDRYLSAITREFGYSETVFVYPPADPANAARLRIFTPTQEVPFAGHPVIGTAVMLASRARSGTLTFELGIGAMEVAVSDGTAQFTNRTPLDILSSVSPDTVAECLGLPVGAVIGDATHASVGLPFVLAELADDAALAGCAPDIAAMRDAAARHPSAFDFAIYAYVRDGRQVRARMFAPLDDIPEDPGTGSAAAALGAWLARDAGSVDLTIRQGEAMGRPCTIGVTADAGGVAVSGAAVRVCDGRLRLPV